jgi:hypothetical protein
MPTCPACGNEVLAGRRWCDICHTNVLNPAIGRLASPGKRLGGFVLDVVIPIVVVIVIFLLGLGVPGDLGANLAVLLLIG